MAKQCYNISEVVITAALDGPWKHREVRDGLPALDASSPSVSNRPYMDSSIGLNATTTSFRFVFGSSGT
jgi:hypothetical protein